MPRLPHDAKPYLFDLSASRSEFEMAIAKESVEVAAAFDHEDAFLLRPRTGIVDEVAFAEEEFPMLRGSVVTHNHPSGGVFSEQDAFFAAAHDLAALRAVSSREGLVFVLLRPSSGWPHPRRMVETAEPTLAELRKENARRKARGESLLKGARADEWAFAYQRDAFAALGVRMKRVSPWERP